MTVTSALASFGECLECPGAGTYLAGGLVCRGRPHPSRRLQNEVDAVGTRWCLQDHEAPGHDILN